MTRKRLRNLLLAGLLATLVPTAGPAPTAAAEPADDDGFVSLFDGKSLDGWKKIGGRATYQIEGDTIVGKVGPGSNTFLRTEKNYGDFILKLDLKLDIPGNSGIQFRSHQQKSDDGNGRVFGYQAEVDPTSRATDPSARAWSAGIYDEARRGWLFPLTGHPEAQKAFNVEGWNH
jgi:3-keto-disaccharide hydrolase